MVSVPWLILKCPKCNIFGHTKKDCMKKQVAMSIEEKEGMKNKGKADSIKKFTVLPLEEEDKVEQSFGAKSSMNKNVGDSVASLMENIKAQFRKTHVKEVFVSDKSPIPSKEVNEKLNVIEGTGNSTLVERVEANQVNQGVATKESENKGEATIL
ncbi:hypothetical protein PTKIN_Ptkin11bG0150300 [Pterospermum kingtungense]